MDRGRGQSRRGASPGPGLASVMGVPVCRESLPPLLSHVMSQLSSSQVGKVARIEFLRIPETKYRVASLSRALQLGGSAERFNPQLNQKSMADWG
eukprot:5260166-Prymnesium_polylepis.1